MTKVVNDVLRSPLYLYTNRKIAMLFSVLSTILFTVLVTIVMTVGIRILLLIEGPIMDQYDLYQFYTVVLFEPPRRIRVVPKGSQNRCSDPRFLVLGGRNIHIPKLKSGGKEPCFYLSSIILSRL